MEKKPPLDTLMHYGTKRKSGRYAWGSGEDSHQSEKGSKFLADVDSYRAKGMKDTDIAEKMGMNTTQLRNGITWANKEQRENLQRGVAELDKTGMSNTAMAEKLGTSEATIRNYRNKLKENPADKHQKMQLDEVSNAIKDGVDKTGYLDVGVGVERQLGVSRTKFNAVVNKLAAEEGYNIHEVYVKRLSDPTGTKNTTVKVLTKDPDPINTRNNAHTVSTLKTQINTDGKIGKIGPPVHLELGRIKVRYKEDGGEDKDGLIELRPGVKDLDLGNKKYAQVRIAAGDDLYLKGMVAYTDAKNFPDGVDVIFNTNKGKDIPKEKVLKKMNMDNPENPFGANIVKQKGKLNIVNEEGDWDTWSTTLSSQFLSKQPLSLIKDRLDATYDGVRNEYDEINRLTNPVVKKHLMDKYIESMDSKAKHLKAKGLTGTMSHVLLPFPDLKPNEIYAPNYKNGERVVLVRHPHGGKFEIPDLVVNNRSKSGIAMIGPKAPDAVGIHPSVAQKLSGADFDGDTALVIPNNRNQIKTERSLKELKNFDPNMYKVDYDTISPKMKQTQMGVVSNLITDMTIKNASNGELARAVKHSMVVIDSEKHKLDYKQSARDNGISALIKKYQTNTNPETGKLSRGASTLISRSKNKIDISQSKTVKELTTDKVHSTTGKVLKKGISRDEAAAKVGISRKTVDDYLDKGQSFNPDKYSSGTATEELYSGYVKGIMKTKNEAVKTSMSIKTPPKSKEAAKVYEPEVKSLDSKLNTALLNAPRERQAQLLTNHLYYSNKKPGMDKDDLKKLKKRSLARAREETGSNATASRVVITEKEWEAIQARAVSPTKLKQILDNSDMDVVRKLATPREVRLSTGKLDRASTLLSKGYTYSEVAQTMGVSTKALREELSRAND